MFECNKCGLCCRQLSRSEVYKDLHKGDGICQYLKGNLCSIYNTRPLLCCIDESYDILFKTLMSKEKYYELNYKVCNELQTKINEK